MEHWERVLPGRMLNLDYETLVADPEPQIRRLLDYCGLAWNDACLSPQSAGNVVTTASRVQVRAPISAASVARWRRYERHLGPLLALLGHA